MTPPRHRRPAPARRDRAGPGAVWAFGRRAALEAIRARRAREIVLAAADADVAPILSEAGRAGIGVRRVTAADLDGMAAGVRHQGVGVRAVLPEVLGERDMAERDWGPEAIVVVLDGIEDPQNVGAVARVAEAAGAGTLILRERRAGGVTAAAVRASAGALVHLPVARVANLRRAIDRLRASGFTAVGLDANAPAAIERVAPPDGPVALVVGSEGAGLSRLVREGCDLLVAIPMRGRVESLNASSAVAAALWGFLLRPAGSGTPQTTAGQK